MCTCGRLELQAPPSPCSSLLGVCLVAHMLLVPVLVLSGGVNE